MADAHSSSPSSLDGAFLLSLLQKPSSQSSPAPPHHPLDPAVVAAVGPSLPPFPFHPHPPWDPQNFPTLPGPGNLQFPLTEPQRRDLGLGPLADIGRPSIGDLGWIFGAPRGVEERRGSSSRPPPGFGHLAAPGRGGESVQGVGFRAGAGVEQRHHFDGKLGTGLLSSLMGVQGQRHLELDGLAGAAAVAVGLGDRRGGEGRGDGLGQRKDWSCGGVVGEGIWRREVQLRDAQSQIVNYEENLEARDRGASSGFSLNQVKHSAGLEPEVCDPDSDNECHDEKVISRMRMLHVADEHGTDGFSLKQDNLVDLENIHNQTVETLEATVENISGSTRISRGKDYRSDFSRGHNVSSQRFRIQRRTIRCRHDIDAFAPNFLSIFGSLVPADEEKAKQKQLLMTLGKLINNEWPDAKLYLYGSCANSFGVSNSDVDVCLSINDKEISKSDILLKLADILQNGNLENVQALIRARVPIVKLRDPVTGLSCDICINNLLAVVNTKLLRDYALIDARLRQLAFIVKHWAKSRCVNETYQGTLSSYAYVLMCIHFLQLRRPAILPCLQAMEPTYAITVDNTVCSYFDQVERLQLFGSRNKESISRLVWAFFQYWAYHHDYANDVISVRTGSLISKQAKDWTRRIGNDRHLICIEDPFETSHDLGRVVDKFSIKILREEFERAANILQFDPNPSVTLFEPYVRDTAEN